MHRQPFWLHENTQVSARNNLQRKRLFENLLGLEICHRSHRLVIAMR